MDALQCSIMQALPGFRDFFPEAMAKRNHVFAAWRRVARRFGFREYDGPPLEFLDLYTRKSGAEIVSQLYCFQDKGGRDVSLRPEMTPTLARMMAAKGASLPKPVKWFSIPQLFRYEKSQRGRLREHFQLNVDIVGSDDVAADVELVSVALDIQRELGLNHTDVVARVNDRRIMAGALQVIDVPGEKTNAVYGAIDKYRKVRSAEEFKELLIASGVQDDRVEDLVQLCRGAVPLRDWFGRHLEDERLESTRRAVEDFERYFELLDEAGLRDYVEPDFSIVRGLAYYTGIVFELYDRKGKERAICGGGRYDDLIASLGGPSLTALGFGMGDVVLSLMLEDRDLFPDEPSRVDVVVLPVTPELAGEARLVTRELREASVASVDTPYRTGKLGKELRAADQARVKLAVLLGPEELEKGLVDIKDLRSDKPSQEPVLRSEIIAEIRKRLDGKDS